MCSPTTSIAFTNDISFGALWFNPLSQGYVSAGVPSNALRVALAAILLVSAFKLWRKSDKH